MPKALSQQKIWITRSQPGAARSGARLKAAGYDTLIAPLLEIGPPKAAPPNIPEKAVLLITSQNALWALAAQTDARHWTCVCVGTATAQIAKGLGFETVYAGPGRAKDILPLIRAQFTPQDGPFIHLSGETIRGNLAQDLQAQGYDAQRLITYAANPVADLPGNIVSDIDVVFLYSPKGAACLRKIIPHMGHVVAVSISQETDAALKDKVFAQRLIAASPNEAAMLMVLDCA